MQFSVLSSGSKANCTFFESDGVRILIDCGLSARETERRLGLLGIDPLTITAILVTHEHYDHVCGISTFSKRFKIPVFANRATMRALKNPFAVEYFKTGENFDFKGLDILPFKILHDAVDPVGFSITSKGFKFVQLTDLGEVNHQAREATYGANAIVLESNHDTDMLQTCSYAWSLKQRIASTHGHLSNDAAGRFLSEILHPEMSHVVLGHISENSNTELVALDTVKKHLTNNTLRSLVSSSVYHATELFNIERALDVGIEIQNVGLHTY